MKVRLFICEMLVKLCNWILPEAAEVVIPNIRGYKASKVGMTLRYTDDIIQKLTNEMKGNKKEARRYIVDEAKTNITNAIFNAVVKEKLIKFNVSYPQKGEISVSGELKVYVPNE